MFKSKLFEQWLSEIKEARIKALFEVKEMVATFKKANREQCTHEVVSYDPFERAANESDAYKNYIKEHYKNIHIIPEMSQCCCFKTTKEYGVHESEEYDRYSGKVKQVKTFTSLIIIDGEVYEDYLYSTGSYIKAKETYDGLADYLRTREHSLSDANLIDRRDEAWIIKRAEKENENLRKALIAKVEKICGPEIVEVTDAIELYLKGSNGRTAKLWAISAGGYNIQCLHTRVLVKEVK